MFKNLKSAGLTHLQLHWKSVVLLVALLLLAAVCVLWGDEGVQPIASWFLSAVGAALLSVLLIDLLSSVRRYEHELPRLRCAVREVRGMLGDFFHLWSLAVGGAHSDPSKPPSADTDSLLAANRIKWTLEHLDLMAPAPVTPNKLWGAYFTDEIRRLQLHCRDICGRHAGVLPPDIFEYVFSLGFADPPIGFTRSGFEHKRSIGQPIPLGDLWWIEETTVNAIRKLDRWSEEEMTKLAQSDPSLPTPAARSMPLVGMGKAMIPTAASGA